MQRRLYERILVKPNLPKVFLPNLNTELPLTTIPGVLELDYDE